MDRPAASFGALLRRYRLLVGLSQGELAERAGLSLNAVGSLERGIHHRPYPKTVALLADALGLDAHQRSALVTAARSRLGGQAPRHRNPGMRSPGGPMAGSIPTSLPAATTSFVGREREVAKLRALLRRPDVRLLTLSGTAGVGKTRLALEVARGLLADFPDGVFFASLASLNDASLVAGSLAQTLGIKESGTRPRVEDLKNFLSLRSCLLVCDNFEQVLGAAPDLGDLLAACPGIKILATSRAALRVYGEHQFVVDPLTLPPLDPLPPLDQLPARPAIRLFVERARAAQADFALTGDNAQAVAEICHRLDGLPLAIELAAARARIFPPAALLARLDNRWQLLADGARDLPTRQQTLRAALAWSYDLLTPAERRLFERVCVFVGSFDLAAAEAVRGAEPIPGMPLIPGIESLVAQSLLRSVPSDHEPRFGLLETMREFGLERLDATGARDELERAHARYYSRLAVEAVGPDYLPWYGIGLPAARRLAGEEGNFRAALRWLIAREESDQALRLAWALCPFWADQGRRAEGLQWLATALALPCGSEPVPHRVRALETAAYLANHRDFDAAVAYAEEALTLSRSRGDPIAVSRLLVVRGVLANQRGDYAGARQRLDEAVILARHLGDAAPLAVVLTQSADSAIDRGDYVAGRSLVDEALAFARATHQGPCVAHNLYNQGRLAVVDDDPDVALARYQDCLAVVQELDLEGDAGLVLYGLAYVACRKGQIGTAETKIAEGFRISRRIEHPLGINYGLDMWAVLAAARGDQAQAACLAGACSSVRDATRAVRHPIWQTLLRRMSVPLARPTEPALAASWDAGRAMTLEQAVARALGEDGTEAASPSAVLSTNPTGRG